MIMFLLNKLVNMFHRFIKRPINQLHRYDYPPENNGWIKIGEKPVWGDANTGTMFDPYSYLEDGIIKMVVSDRKKKRIILLESINGISWEKKSDLLAGKEGSWDYDVNRGCMLYHNNKYYLWYTGQADNKSAIGVCISNDGRTFNRLLDRPVIVASNDCEGVSVMNPCVLWDTEDAKFKMWYSAGDTYEPDVICYAESYDGLLWVKNTKPVLEKYPCHQWERFKVGGCCVIKRGEYYQMYYIGYQNIDVARICVAYSKDGIKWLRDENNLQISPTRNSWDSDATYKPTVVEKEGKLYLWYNGRKGYEEYIGLAIKE